MFKDEASYCTLKRIRCGRVHGRVVRLQMNELNKWMNEWMNKWYLILGSWSTLFHPQRLCSLKWNGKWSWIVRFGRKRSFYVPIYKSPMETEETNGTPSVAIANNAFKILDWQFSKENLESSLGSKNSIQWNFTGISTCSEWHVYLMHRPLTGNRIVRQS
jgi:hypothetical protein